MEALIIAAGRGSRLNHRHSPKPLTRMMGLNLLERIILTAKNAGVEGFKIVVGYKAEAIKQALGNGEKYGTTIEYIYNPEWQKGNGVSVLAAKDYFHEPFILLMADHLFEESIIRDLLNFPIEDGECVLAIDRNLKGSHFSLDDVTKVLVDDGYISKIGKTVHQYNALDTGFFLCTPVLFQALEHSVANGDYGLSGGNQILASMGSLRTLDITGRLWIDVDDEVAYKKAKRTLVRSLLKQTDGPISKRLNRKISSRVSSFLSERSVTPNHMTWVSFVVAALAAACFYKASYAWILLGGVLAQLSSILDGCDGEIARLKFQHSFFGMWLDRILDRYADGLIIIGMTYALWLRLQSPLAWLVGGLALLGTFLNSYTAVAYDKLVKRGLVAGNNHMRIGRDVRLFVVFLGAVLNQLMTTLLVLVALTHFESIRRLLLLRHVTTDARVAGTTTVRDYLPLPGA
ncbi:MAG: nucleotidyl transferase [Calditrichaeota bacterium]|nr:MAG: nucleotidyl transferase [Calditrichota bacterium]